MRYIEPSSNVIAQAMLGSGNVPIYAGSLSQSGYGFGGLLKRTKWRVIPLVKGMAGPHIGKFVKGVVKDALRFRSLRESIKRHGKKQGFQFVGKTLTKLGNRVKDGSLFGITYRTPFAANKKKLNNIAVTAMKIADRHAT